MIEISIIFIFILTVPLGVRLWGFIKYRKNYPIVGKAVPQRILKRGDEVSFTDGSIGWFEGVEPVNWDLVFKNDDSIYDRIITRQEFLDTAVAIKNEYGFKWIKSNYNLTNSTCS